MKYGAPGQKFREELAAFKRMHDRVRDGKVMSIQWPRTKDGFLKFLASVGPIPSRLKKPSIGRKNHSKGYRAGNLQWEEHRLNSIKRLGTKHQFATGEVEFAPAPKRRGTKQFKLWWRAELKRRWASAEFRKKHATGIKRAWAEGKFSNRRSRS